MESPVFCILTLPKYLPVKKFPLYSCHCFTKTAAPLGADCPARLYGGLPYHPVVTLIGSTMVTNKS